MKKQYRSFLSYLALPCLLSTMSLRADDMNSSDMNSCDEGAKSNFVSTYDRIKDKEITPNAGPAVNGGADIFIEADYIYWYVSEDGLNYAAGGVLNNSFGSSNNVFCQQSRAGIKGKMASGFKVAAGLDLDYDGWDTLAQYTWLRVNSRSHHGHCYCDSTSTETGTSSAGMGPYYPMLDGNFNTFETFENSNYSYSLATGATGQWRLHFNVIDWEVGRSFFISPKLVLRPHMGLKGTWQKQWYDIDYTLVGSADPSFDPVTGVPTEYTYTDETEVYSVYNQQRYWGIGTRMGLDTSWMISKCFSIFGEMSASTMFGYFKDTRTDVSNVVDTTSKAVIVENNTRINLAGRRHQVNAVLETQIGLRYDYMFSDDEYRFRLQAGWESQLWFNQNHFLGDDLANQQGADLGFEGLTVNVRFDF